jgi:hypothetical protein
LDQNLGLLVKVLDQFLYMGQKLKPTSVDPLGLIFQNYLNISKPKFQKPLMNITSKFFSFNVWESFLLSSVLERTESHLSKINWLRGIILLIPIVLVPWGRFSLCHTPIRPIKPESTSITRTNK